MMLGDNNTSKHVSDAFLLVYDTTRLYNYIALELVALGNVNRYNPI